MTTFGPGMENASAICLTLFVFHDAGAWRIGKSNYYWLTDTNFASATASAGSSLPLI
jgi:hypothetical protein